MRAPGWLPRRSLCGWQACSLMRLLDMLFQVSQRLLPELVEIIAHLGDLRRLDAIKIARADRLVADETGVAQRLEMLRHRRPRHRQVAGDVADRAWTFNEHFEDRAPHRI